jgi:hypothetical protein
MTAARTTGSPLLTFFSIASIVSGIYPVGLPVISPVPSLLACLCLASITDFGIWIGALRSASSFDAFSSLLRTFFRTGTLFFFADVLRLPAIRLAYPGIISGTIDGIACFEVSPFMQSDLHDLTTFVMSAED